MVWGSDSYTSQVSTVTRWRLEPRLCLLVLAGMESQAGLDLSGAHTCVLLDSGPGVWEPVVEGPVYRMVVEGTVEEGLLRVGTMRKILQDIDTVQDSEQVTLSRQTLQEVFHPQPDNGYVWHNNTKKKEKVRTWSSFSLVIIQRCAGHV